MTSAEESLSLIYESDTSLIYLQKEVSDGRGMMVVKVLKSRIPDGPGVGRLRNEFNILNGLDLTGVRKLIKIGKIGDNPALFLEYVEAAPLMSVLVGQTTQSVSFLLGFVRETVKILAKLHSNGLVYNHLTPDNLLVQENSLLPVLIDFGDAVRLAPGKKAVAGRHGPPMVSDVPYKAPECLGASIFGFDYRVDYFALGILLKEPIAFCTALIQENIKDGSKQLKSINSHALLFLGKIISKLSANNPDDRYRSSEGILCDLEIVEQNIHNQHDISFLSVGLQDLNANLLRPSTLVGRRQEITFLKSKIEEAKSGMKSAVILKAELGLGKTTLIESLLTEQAELGVLCLRAHFDPKHSKSPFYGIKCLIRDFLNQIRFAGEEVYKKWMDGYLRSAGDWADAMRFITPEFSFMTENSGLPLGISPLDIQNRAIQALCHFFKFIGARKAAVAIFFDEMQWADKPSLSIIEIVLSDVDTQKMFFCGAFDSQSKFDLNETASIFQSNAYPCHLMELKGLSVADIQESLLISFKKEPEQTLGFAKTLHQTSEGNPLKLFGWLDILKAKKQLRHSNTSGWEWEDTAYSEKDTYKKKWEHIKSEFDAQSHDAQRFLSLAAVFGHRFQLAAFCLAMPEFDRNSAEFFAYHWESLGFLKLLPPYSRHTAQGVEQKDGYYAFRHEACLRAIEGCLSQADLARSHLRIGETIIQKSGGDLLKIDLAKLLFYLQRSFPFDHAVFYGLFDEAEPPTSMARLCYEAGKQLSDVGSFEAAFECFNASEQYLASFKNSWRDCYQLMLALRSAKGKTASYVLEQSILDECYASISENAHAPADMIDIFESVIRIKIAQNDLNGALEFGISAAEKLGITIDYNPKNIKLVWEWIKLMPKLPNKSLNEAWKKQIKGVEIQKAAFLSKLMPIAWAISKNTFLLLVFKQLEIAHKTGKSLHAVFAYNIYGAFLCGFMGNVEKGTEVGKAALDMMQQDTEGLNAQSLFIYHAFLSHWKSPLNESIDGLKLAFDKSMMQGNLEWMSITAIASTAYSFWAGTKLNNVHDQIQVYYKALRRPKMGVSFSHLKLYEATAILLMGREGVKESDSGSISDASENAFFQVKSALNNLNLGLHSVITGMATDYLFYDNLSGLEKSKSMVGRKDRSEPSLLIPMFVFYEALLHLAALIDPPKQNGLSPEMGKVKANIKKLKAWCVNSPQNYRHKVALIEAEMLSFENKLDKAGLRFDLAVAFAKNCGNIFDEAVACERAGMHYFRNGILHQAQAMMYEAMIAYHQWGAVAKIWHIKESYPVLFQSGYYYKRQAALNAFGPEGLAFERDEHGGLAETCRWISSITKLDELVRAYLWALIKYGSAKKAFWMSTENKIWMTKPGLAENAEDLHIDTLYMQEEDENNFVAAYPPGLFRYVKETSAVVELNNALYGHSLLNEPYFSPSDVEALYCAPLKSATGDWGLIYLENDSFKNAFEFEAQRKIVFLSKQFMVAMHNVSLIDDLEKSIKRQDEHMAAQVERLNSQKNETEHLHENIKIMADFGLKLSLAQTRQETAAVFRATVPSLFPADGFGIGLPDSNGNKLNFFDFIENGENIGLIELDLTVKSKIGGWSYENGVAVIVNDLENEYKKYLKLELSTVIGSLPKSLIYVPLSDGAKVFGIVTVQCFYKNAYTLYHFDLLKNVAQYISGALIRIDKQQFI